MSKEEVSRPKRNTQISKGSSLIQKEPVRQRQKHLTLEELREYMPELFLENAYLAKTKADDVETRRSPTPDSPTNSTTHDPYPTDNEKHKFDLDTLLAGFEGFKIGKIVRTPSPTQLTDLAPASTPPEPPRRRHAEPPRLSGGPADKKLSKKRTHSPSPERKKPDKK